MDRNSELYAFADLREIKSELFRLAEDLESQERNAYQTRPDFQKQQADHARRDAIKRIQRLVAHYTYLRAAA